MKNAQYSNLHSKKREPFYEFLTRNLADFFQSKGTKFFVPLLILLNGIFLLPGIGGDALLTQGDETMHIATIRESLSVSSYLFPRFEGVLNLYKPPALFWLGMFSDSIFGISFFSERFPSFLLFLGSSLLVYAGLKKGGATPVYSFVFALAYTLTLGVFKFARLAMMESLLTFFITAIAVIILQFRISGKRIWLLLGGLISGIAILIKGPLFQVYSAILFASFSSFGIFILSERKDWSGKKRIWKELLSHIAFHLPAILVPGIWILVLLTYSNLGKEFLRVFFLTENLGKFSSATSNQSEWIIPVGFVLYSFPFSLLLLFSFPRGLFSKGKHLPGLVGSSFLWAIIAIVLVHLSPNRKDFYYLVPVVPLAFLGLGLYLLRSKTEIYIRWLSINFLFCIGTAAVLFAGMFLFDLFVDQLSWQEFAFLILISLVAWIVKASFSSPRGVPTIVVGNLIFAVAILSYIQFSLLPRLSLSEIPGEGPILSAKQICVVSENPWTALTFKNAFPKADTAHSIPGAERNCIDGRRYLVVFDPNFSRRNEYHLVQTQAVWKRDLSWKELLGPSKGKNLVYFFEPNWNSDSIIQENP